MPEHVTKITSTKHGVEIQYKHGKVIKTTFIPSASLIELMNYKLTDDTIDFSLKKKMGDGKLYTFTFLSKEAYYALKRQILISYDMFKKKIPYEKVIKERVAMNIASVFLSKYNPGQIISEPYKDRKFGPLLSQFKVKPDIFVIDSSRKIGIFEVKFVSESRIFNLRRKEAINEVKRQYDIIKSIEHLLKLPVGYYGILIINLNFKKNRMYLYFEKRTNH